MVKPRHIRSATKHGLTGRPATSRLPESQTGAKRQRRESDSLQGSSDIGPVGYESDNDDWVMQSAAVWTVRGETARMADHSTGHGYGVFE